MDTTEDAARAFSNATVGTDELPQLADDDFTPLSPAFLRLRTMTAVAVGVVSLLIAIAVVALSASVIGAAIAAIVLVIVGIGCVLHRLEADRMGYAVREHDLSVRSGVLSRSVSTVPYARVQHVSINRGPIDRRFEIASLQVRTAGGSIGIPGLPNETAERLKLLVTERAAELADAEHENEHEAGEPSDIGLPGIEPLHPGAPLPPPTMPSPVERHDG